jgi:hypothetical protein
MNTPNDPLNPQPTPDSGNPPPVPQLLAQDAGLGAILDTLLKRPLVLIRALWEEARSS